MGRKAELLLLKLDLSVDVYEQGDLYEAIATLFESQLGSEESAFEVYLQAFGTTRDEERFGPHLARLASGTEQWSQVVDMYEQLLNGGQDVLNPVELHLKTALWSNEHLGDFQPGSISL